MTGQGTLHIYRYAARSTASCQWVPSHKPELSSCANISYKEEDMGIKPHSNPEDIFSVLGLLSRYHHAWKHSIPPRLNPLPTHRPIIKVKRSDHNLTYSCNLYHPQSLATHRLIHASMRFSSPPFALFSSLLSFVSLFARPFPLRSADLA